MCDQTSQRESQLLAFSALWASGFAFGGLILGIFASSLVIVFDGVYSLVSVLLTLLSLAVSRYIHSPSQSNFAYGKAVLEPLVIAIKAIVILCVVLYAIYQAGVACFHGGRAVDLSVATWFELFNVIGCGVAWAWLAYQGKRQVSGLVAAERQQWQMDTLLSLVVLIGFIGAMILSFTPWHAYAVYADPVMMLLMSFYFLKVPFNMLKGAMRELLMMSPNQELCHRVGQDVCLVDQLSSQHLELTGVTKVGQELRVQVDVHMAHQTIALSEFEHTRRQLTAQLSKHPFKLNLQLTIA